MYGVKTPIYQYVQDYVAYLDEMGIHTYGRLLYLSEIKEIGCELDTTYYEYICPTDVSSWLGTRTFWTGTANNYNSIGVVFGLDNGYYPYAYYTIYALYGTHGVRPVIILDNM